MTRARNTAGRLSAIAALVAGVAIGSGGITLIASYRAALARERERLTNMAQARARLVDAIVAFDQQYAGAYPGPVEEAAIAQVGASQTRIADFGTSGEFVVARLGGDSISFLVRHRDGLVEPSRIPLDTTLAEPMRRALSGRSGTMVGRDYLGTRVVAAYEPIPSLGLGLVVKIDVAEVRAPYVRAGLLGAAGAAVLIAFGLLGLRRLGRPIVARAEEHLARYRALVERAPNGVLVMHGEVFEECNPASAVIFGAPAKDIIGKRPWDFSPATQPDGRASEAAARDRLTLAAAGQFQRFPWVHRRPDGAQLECEISLTPVRLSGADRILAIVRDATAEVRAGRAVRDSERLFREAADHNPAALFIYGPERRILFGNARAARIAGGVTPDDLVGRRDEDVLPAALVTCFAAIRDRAEAAGKAYSEERSVETPAGRLQLAVTFVPLLDESRDVRRTIAVAYDLTERRRIQDEHALLAEAVAQAGEAVIVTDPDGLVEYVNPAFEHITGYRRADILGQNPRLLKSGVQNEAFYARLWSALKRGEAFRGRFINRRRDGEHYTQDSVITPILDASGAIRHYVAVARDVTRELALEDQLRQSQKLEAVGQLTSGLAHDFNNLLTVILANTGLAATADLPDDIAEHVRDISDAANAARRLVRRLMGFARRTPLVIEPLDLAEAIRGTADMLRRVLPDSIDIRTVIGDPPPVIRGDRVAIEQILLNLATNARDAMPEGGRLSIEADTVSIGEADLQVHPWMRPGTYGRMTIGDTGPGIPAEYRDRVFEPFFTTKELGRGTGLGLSMVYGLVKQHDGFLHVYSEPGQGAHFRIYLHLADAPPAPTRPAGPADTRGGSETILVVEDEEALRVVAERVLRKAGYTVVSAVHGGEALGILTDGAPSIALVLSDYMMPQVGGPELYRRMRGHGLATRFLLSSGHSDKSASILPGVRFLPKPWTVQELLIAVRAALDAPP